MQIDKKGAIRAPIDEMNSDYSTRIIKSSPESGLSSTKGMKYFAKAVFSVFAHRAPLHVLIAIANRFLTKSLGGITSFVLSDERIIHDS